jgi:hypothetical protein
MLEVLYIYTFMIIYVAILQGRDRDESGCGNILLFYTSKVWITNITNWPLAEVGTETRRRQQGRGRFQRLCCCHATRKNMENEAFQNTKYLIINAN